MEQTAKAKWRNGGGYMRGVIHKLVLNASSREGRLVINCSNVLELGISNELLGKHD